MAKILLVEDDNNLREIYEARLQAEGYTIVAAHDGEEALVLAKQELPDLIISDVMMPKISGFEMLDILRNTEMLRDVKIIMLTALGQSEDEQRANRLGADRYLVKSQVTLEDIVKASQQLLGELGDVPTTTIAAPIAATDPIPLAAPSAASPPTPVQPSPPPLAPAAQVISAEPIAPVVTPITATDPVSVPLPPVIAPNPIVVPQPAAITPPIPPIVPVAQTPTMPLARPPAPIGAESEMQEAADVEAQIEDFVAGASSIPTPPPAREPSAETSTNPIPLVIPVPAITADPQAASLSDPLPMPQPTPPIEPSLSNDTIATPPDPVTHSQPGLAEVTPSAAAEIAAADDKLMAEAVDALVANSEAGQAVNAQPAVPPSQAAPLLTGSAVPLETSATPTPMEPLDMSIPPPVESPTPDSNEPKIVLQSTSSVLTPPATDSANSDKAADQSVLSGEGHKKVIMPIGNDLKKPDLNSLLAAEDAKDIMATQSTPLPPPPEVPPPVQSPPPSAGNQPVDPNSIAL